MRILRPFLILFVLAYGSRSTLAQHLPFVMDMPIEGISSYDPSIPTPEEVLGHPVGSTYSPPHEVVQYFKAVAAVSDRVMVREYARTYEGRPLIHAFVTSPTNQARLESIRQQNLRLSEDPNSVTEGEMASMPVILYQGYSIHGDEASGSDASLLYLYHLAAGQGPAVDDALEHAVVIMDPLFNPDGRDRFVDWVNRNRGAVPVSDGNDREHNQAWPGGRTNHYWFDLNRDWLVAVHPESQGRLKVFHSWRPHVLTDHHEMGGGSTFFFQPGVPSRTNRNTPDRNQQLTYDIAEFHARQLDAIGSQYFSQEGYDDFFYGKGSAFPDVNGSLGILFEQASSRALIAEEPDGLLHYAFTVRNQFAASLSTLAAGVALREKLLDNQRLFYAEAREMAAEDPVKAYVLDLVKDRTKAQFLVQMLRRHDINVYDLSDDLSVDGHSFAPGEAYVIPTAQRQYRLLKSSFETIRTFEDSIFYDVSTWTLPLAHDVDTYEYRRDPSGMVGEEVPAEVMDGGSVTGGLAAYGYLLTWDRYFAPRALYRLQEAGIPARLMNKRFSSMVGGTKMWFEPGTVFIPLKGRLTPGKSTNPQHIRDLVTKIAAEDQVTFFAVDSGYTPDGPDLGGGSTTTLQQPVIALVAGPGVSSGDAGEAWFAISERFRLPVSLIDPSDLRSSVLSRYNVLVLPGSPSGDAATQAVRGFMASGGTVVVTAAGSGWATREYFDAEARSIDMDSLVAGLPYDRISDTRGGQVVGGSIFEIDLDTTHPVAYGMPDLMPAFRTSSTFYDYNGDAGTLVGAYTQKGILSGYISPERLATVPGAAAILADRFGRGHLIVFMDHVNRRGYWLGTQRLFFNAIFFGKTF